MNIITSVALDNLIFDSVNYIISQIDGLESPLIRLPRYNLPGSSGAFISNALYGERSIKIKGVVNAPDGTATTYLLNRVNLINALNYKRDANDRPVPQTLTITLANGQVLTTKVYIDTPLAMGFSPDQTDYEEFLITLIAPDPNLYSSTQIVNTISFPIGGGTAIPTAIPISLAPSSGGNAIVVNLGSTTSYPVITINAPVVNPYIINSRVGNFLKLNYTLNIGDQPLIINCNTQTIYQGSNLKNGIQSQDSIFWGVVSGNNIINYSGSSGTGSASIAFYSTFIGV